MHILTVDEMEKVAGGDVVDAVDGICTLAAGLSLFAKIAAMKAAVLAGAFCVGWNIGRALDKHVF